MRLIDADKLMSKLNSISEAESQIFGKASWGFAAKCINVIENSSIVDSGSIESLTDDEKRIFLSAMSREEKVCKEIVGLHSDQRTDLVRICHEITRKVKEALWT